MTAQLGPFTIGGTTYLLTQAERVIVRRIYRGAGGGRRFKRHDARSAAAGLDLRHVDIAVHALDRRAS